MLGFLGVIFKEKITFKKCNFKVLISIYIFCEVLSLSFKLALHKRVFNALHSNSLGQLIKLFPFEIQNLYIRRYLKLASKLNPSCLRDIL